MKFQKLVITLIVAAVLFNIYIMWTCTFTVRVFSMDGKKIYEESGLRILEHTARYVRFLDKNGKFQTVTGNFIVVQD